MHLVCLLVAVFLRRKSTYIDLSDRSFQTLPEGVQISAGPGPAQNLGPLSSACGCTMAFPAAAVVLELF